MFGAGSRKKKKHSRTRTPSDRDTDSDDEQAGGSLSIITQKISIKKRDRKSHH